MMGVETMRQGDGEIGRRGEVEKFRS